MRRPDRVRARVIRLRRRCEHSGRHELDDSARTIGRVRRSERRRQVDAREPRAALLRSDVGVHPARRHDLRELALDSLRSTHRHRESGDDSVLRDGARESLARRAECDTGADHCGARGSECARVRAEAAGRIGDGSRRAGRGAFRRTEAASGDRASLPEGSEDPDSGRGDIRARFAGRSAAFRQRQRAYSRIARRLSSHIVCRPCCAPIRSSYSKRAVS